MPRASSAHTLYLADKHSDIVQPPNPAMSKRTAKAQASSARAATTSSFGAFGSASAAFSASTSPLSYVTEPPDLSAISDPNVIVYFRNLSKKDSTTKAKALEDIQSYLSSLQEPVEEGLLEAWIKIYPRTSIDNAKAVRQNAHLVHGQFAVSAGKRIARHMPKSVAAWLCGLYDSDRYDQEEPSLVGSY